MNKGLRVMAAGLLTAGLLAGGQAAFARDGDIVRRGDCSRASEWKLKLSRENGRIEVEFEVDQNVVGRTWRVALADDGTRFFRGRRTTKRPSGSFEVRKLTANNAGPDRISARARSLSSGERCVGSAVFR